MEQGSRPEMLSASETTLWERSWYWRQKGLPGRAATALASAGINTLDDLKQLTANELLRLPNFGYMTLRTVQQCTGWPKDLVEPDFRKAVERFARECLRRFNQPEDAERIRRMADRLLEWLRSECEAENGIDR